MVNGLNWAPPVIKFKVLMSVTGVSVVSLLAVINVINIKAVVKSALHLVDSGFFSCSGRWV